MKLFLSLLSVRGEKNAVLGLGVGSNPGPFALESCVLPCAPLHIHLIDSYVGYGQSWLI